ncbi:MAG: hypothetical protein ACI4U3_08440 [Traorella sp.]
MKNLQEKYQQSRNNLFLMIILTIINMILAFIGSDIMLLFSATIPYFMAVVGYYLDLPVYLIGACCLMLVYLGCWYLSKRHVFGLVIALFLFILDILFMFWTYNFELNVSMILDILIHIWVLYYLISGVITGFKLKKEYVNESEVVIEEMDEEEAYEKANEVALRKASDTKARVLLEFDTDFGHVVYRRVKKVNELVVNGKVYDEYEALVEFPHSLLAKVDGHVVEVGYDGKNSYALVDGNLVLKKLRLY